MAKNFEQWWEVWAGEAGRTPLAVQAAIKPTAKQFYLNGKMTGGMLVAERIIKRIHENPQMSTLDVAQFALDICCVGGELNQP